MAALSSIQHLLDNQSLSIKFVLAVTVFGLTAYAYSIYASASAKLRPIPGFPTISLTEKGLDPKQSWFTDGMTTVLKGILDTNDGVFQVITGNGPKLIVPNKYVDELKNNPALSFHEAANLFWPVGYHGFEPMAVLMDDETILAEVVRGKLTQSISPMVHALVDEVSTSVKDTFGDPSESATVSLRKDLRDIVARVSSRAFLGKTLCRDERWLRIAKEYTIDTFDAAQRLRMLPPLIRPLAHRIIPVCRRIQNQYEEARRLIKPEVDRRVARTRQALAEGERAAKTSDAIGWMVEAAMKPGAIGAEHFDFAAGQLHLSVAGIHNTSEYLAWAILDICDHPEIVVPLRQEIIEVIGAEGWTKNSLYKLRLMDSFLKESQRVHPQGPTNLTRRTLSDIEMSNGTILPAGSSLEFTTVYDDPDFYEDPERFDVARYVKLREKEPEQESKWQAVAISRENLTFGGGKSACPGRFLATAELKIAIAHLIMKYDWRHVDGPIKAIHREGINILPGGIQAMCRRRKEEIDMDVEMEEDV